MQPKLEETVENMDYKDRSSILVFIGILQLLIGVVSACFGPAEIYCYYLFSQGGRFFYEGFGFGSFTFGLIACQIIGYYLIAILFIPLGWGHLKKRRWARTLSLVSLWFWFVVGLPVIILFLPFFMSKGIFLGNITVTIFLFLGILYFLIPGLLIWFYHSKNVRLTFETKDPEVYWTEKLPSSILVLCFLFVFYVIALHMSIFFKCIFPLFGNFLFYFPGMLLIEISIIGLICLIWGTLKLRIWAWWGALVYFSLLTISSLMTFSKFSFSDIYLRMNFPEKELEFFQKLPFQDFHLTLLFGIPLLITLGLIVFSRRYFRMNSAVRNVR
jgi:hypothetical protein